MDISKRQITKIAREVTRFALRMFKTEGVGPAEIDFIHVIRKNPGITQTSLREILSLDKGATARRTTNLEAKGYLVKKSNPKDGRSQRLYATHKAELLKTSTTSVETLYYQWLGEVLTPEENAQFCRILDRLYQRSKAESKAGFPNLTKLYIEGGLENGPREADY